MRPRRVARFLGVAVSGAILGACGTSTSDVGDHRSDEAGAGGAEVVVLPGTGSSEAAWDVSEDLVRLRDSLDAAPAIERPDDPTIPQRDRAGALAPEGCSPMPNAWLDLPLCRGR